MRQIDKVTLNDVLRLEMVPIYRSSYTKFMQAV
jgi:hypothetical protein